MDFKKLQLEKAKEIDGILLRYLPEPAGDQAACMQDMGYTVMGGGKRLRPMLMRETCALFTEDTSVAEPFMAAIEMIHTYSLIHDDIMDDDDERRGRPTIHAKYRREFLDRISDEAERRSDREPGEKTEDWNIPDGKSSIASGETDSEARRFGDSMGILAGDALLTYAFQIMADAACREFSSVGQALERTERAKRTAGSSAESAGPNVEGTAVTVENAAAEAKHMSRAAAEIRAMSLIAEKAGVRGMVGGQVIDVQNVGSEMSAEQVKNINELKTSALIEASMMAGAILGGADEDSLRKIEQAASMIGQAFQIEDDILDVTGNAADLGKPVGSDDKNNKNTYVRIYGLAECRRMVEELSEEAIRVMRECDCGREPDGFLEELLRSLVNRDH